MLFEYVPETNQMRLETIILTLISSILGVNPPQEKNTHFWIKYCVRIVHERKMIS